MSEYRYQYGAPNPPRLVSQEPPRCWGKSYDENDRECKGCGFQASCREEVFRKNAEPRPVTASYWAAQAPRPYAAPIQVQPMAVQPYVPPFPQMATMRPVAQPVQASPGPMPAHRYGWLQDPMYQVVHSAPPPMRPQMQGEGFMERMVKNVALSMLEKGVAECLLAIRQMVFAPKPQTIDVVPTPPTNQ